ncbi:hypothetical protein ACEPAI_9719 [Sanghuangporus weigelae]
MSRKSPLMTAWPNSHVGPVITYLAAVPVGTDVTTYSPGTDPVWFKIDEAGKNDQGEWAATYGLYATNSVYSVSIPESLRPGQYIVRHEIVALHQSYSYPGAQFYPSCIQIEVTGCGNAFPTDDFLDSFPGAYTPDTPGIVYDVYTNTSAYPIPGPAVWSPSFSFVFLKEYAASDLMFRRGLCLALNDVLLKILYKLEVQEILRIERTCRSMRKYILHDARHLWLVKLYDLDVSCDPGIPPNVSVEHLPIEELRSIVVRAVRLYTAMTGSPTPMITYALKKTIVPTPPEAVPSGITGFIHSVKLLPGGRYVFVCWKTDLPNPGNSDYKTQLCMIDTISNHRVWSFDSSKHHGNVPARMILAYDFDMQKDGSIIMALVFQTEDENSDLSGLLQVFRLSSEPTGGTFTDSLLHSVSSLKRRMYGHKPPTDRTFCQISDDFVALVDHGTGIITLLKWDEGRMINIAFERTHDRGFWRIWNNHVFYFVFRLQELRAVSLSQAMEFPESHSSQQSILNLEQFNTVTLQLDGRTDQNGEPLIAGDRNSMLYSIYDAPWDNSEAVLTIVTQVSTGFPHFTAIRAKFHSVGPDGLDWKWEFLSERTSREHSHSSRISFMMPKQTRSGQLLAYSWKKLESTLETGIRQIYPYCLQRRVAVVAVDREGYPFIPQLSENMANLLVGAEDEVDIRCLDEYSRAIVVVRNVWPGKDFIEIYYPE